MLRLAVSLPCCTSEPFSAQSVMLTVGLGHSSMAAQRAATLRASDKLHAIDPDREGAVVLVERERRALGRDGSVEQAGRLHEGNPTPRPAAGGRG